MKLYYAAAMCSEKRNKQFGYQLIKKLSLLQIFWNAENALLITAQLIVLVYIYIHIYIYIYKTK